MPPKYADLKTLIGKRDNAIQAIKEVFEEFEEIHSVQPQLQRLESTFNIKEAKYRSIKKQQEIIADKIVEEASADTDEVLAANQKIGESLKDAYLKVAKAFDVYQKSSTQPTATAPDTLDAMTSAVTKMAEALQASKSGSRGLERLPVPTWDGSRRSYKTWKKEFNHWTDKYSQDKDEQLQHFRRAMPKGFWWTDQVKTCKSIDRAWEILDVEFANKRKLMDELLARISNLKSVKGDSKSFTRYATQIAGFVNDMEDNDCAVTSSSEAPFFMSQLLSKLDTKDNAEFGREMRRSKKEENVQNLIQWLHDEASVRSRGKCDSESNSEERGSQRGQYSRKTANHSPNADASKDTCPLGCQSTHMLAACPRYQASTVDQRWEIVKKHQICRKCLQSHHTKDCKKADGSTCDKCEKNHHKSLHNDKKVPPPVPDNSVQSLDPNAAPFQASDTGSVNSNAETKSIAGLLPIQNIKIQNADGESIDVLAMLDSGSNTSLLSKSAAKKLGLSGPKTHLTMNLAGGANRSEISEIIEITLVSSVEEHVKKPLVVHTVNKPCSSAKTISKNSLGQYSHIAPILDKLHLKGGQVDLLLGTDFTDGFIDVHVEQGKPGEPIAKMNCFGWYVIGQLSPNQERILSVDVDTMSIRENIVMLLQQDQLGVKPTKFCTCTDNELRENKFVRSLSESTTIVDGRIQVRMPWKETGPPQESNYDIALKRMSSSEKSFKTKKRTEDVAKEVAKLVDQRFVKLQVLTLVPILV